MDSADSVWVSAQIFLAQLKKEETIQISCSFTSLHQMNSTQKQRSKGSKKRRGRGSSCDRNNVITSSLILSGL